MDSGEVLQAFGRVAGIGGLGLGVFLIIFRDVIRRKIFPALEPTHAYRLISLIVILTFLISAAGIGAYVYLQSSPHLTETKFPVKSPQAVVMAHLALIDHYRYADAYARLSSDARLRISPDVFNKVFESQRTPKGSVLRRAFYGATSSTQLPDLTRGAFNTTTYLSDFETGRFIESITVQAENNEWKVLFHTLTPCQAPACS